MAYKKKKIRYDRRFTKKDQGRFVSYEIKSEIANAYHKRFSELGITNLLKINCMPKKANMYDESFTSEDIRCLFAAGCLPAKANKYKKRFSSFSIAKLFKAGCMPRTANMYDERFECGTIAELFKAGCMPRTANKYHKGFAGRNSVVLYKTGIRPDNMNFKKQERLYFTLLMISTLGGKTISNPDNYSLIGTGRFSVVLLKKDKQTAWKFSRSIKKEAKLLRKLKYNYPLKNIIKIKGKGYVQQESAVELEYIEGKTLEQILTEKSKLPVKNVLEYSADILNGILELRQAGIYHRDLHDRNILIDKEKNQAVIIDLGAATENPEEIHELNRAYGGNNDLISLGQLMYKMSTGHNLFNEGNRLTHYSEVKKGIKTKREKIYDNHKEKTKMISKVRQDIKDKNLTKIIVNLLNDNLWIQPSIERVKEVNKMFEGYLK